MKTFLHFLIEQDVPPPTGGGGMTDLGGLSTAGSMPGGTPPPMGGLGGGMPPPSMGGLGGLGGPTGMGGPTAGATSAAQSNKLKAYNVWDALEKVLDKD